MALRSSLQGIARCAATSLAPEARVGARFASSSTSASSTSNGEGDEATTSTSSNRYSLPHHSIEIGPTQLSRYQEHYHNSLARDLLYMSYDPLRADLGDSHSTAQENELPERGWDPTSPYTKNRPARPLRGNRLHQPQNDGRGQKDVVKLERIVITAFAKEAIANKNVLIPLLAQFRSITGLPIVGSFGDPSLALPEVDATPESAAAAKKGYVKVLRAKSGASSFKLRPGMPVGVQAVLPATKAYDFLEIFVTFVLPRLRTFGGFPLPPPSQPPMSPAALSGVVHLGMGPEAVALFPQTEVNWDSYPGRSVGFQVSLFLLLLLQTHFD